jgi:hypothetical protein
MHHIVSFSLPYFIAYDISLMRLIQHLCDARLRSRDIFAILDSTMTREGSLIATIYVYRLLIAFHHHRLLP